MRHCDFLPVISKTPLILHQWCHVQQRFLKYFGYLSQYEKIIEIASAFETRVPGGTDREKKKPGKSSHRYCPFKKKALQLLI
jgi:hypothetical protein